MNNTALAAEINSDPEALGYAAFVASGSDAGIAALMNVPGSARISRGLVTTEVFMVDFGDQVLGIKADPVLSISTTFAPLLWSLGIVGTIDYSNAIVQGALAAMVTAGIGGLTTDQVTEITTRPCSRAETLWGAGTVVSGNDVSFAVRGAQ